MSGAVLRELRLLQTWDPLESSWSAWLAICTRSFIHRNKPRSSWAKTRYSSDCTSCTEPGVYRYKHKLISFQERELSIQRKQLRMERDQALDSLKERLIQVWSYTHSPHVCAHRHRELITYSSAVTRHISAGAHRGVKQSELGSHVWWGSRGRRSGGVSSQTAEGQRRGAEAGSEEHGSVERAHCSSSGMQVRGRADSWTGEVAHEEPSQNTEQAHVLFCTTFYC